MNISCYIILETSPKTDECTFWLDSIFRRVPCPGRATVTHKRNNLLALQTWAPTPAIRRPDSTFGEFMLCTWTRKRRSVKLLYSWGPTHNRKDARLLQPPILSSSWSRPFRHFYVMPMPITTGNPARSFQGVIVPCLSLHLLFTSTAQGVWKGLLQVWKKKLKALLKGCVKEERKD